MEGGRPEETEKERLWETEKKERETVGGTKSPGETKKEILIKLEKEARKRQKKKTDNTEKKVRPEETNKGRPR